MIKINCWIASNSQLLVGFWYFLLDLEKRQTIRLIICWLTFSLTFVNEIQSPRKSSSSAIQKIMFMQGVFVEAAILLFLLFLIGPSLNFVLPINDLQSKIKGSILTPEDKDYHSLILIDNGLYQSFPKLLVLPVINQDIIETIRFAQKYNQTLTVRGGGHSAAGYCLNKDIVLHMKYFNKTSIIANINDRSAIAKIEAGLNWSVIYPSLAPYVPVAGTCPLVGVIGYTLGGGYSMLSRSYGLAIDNLIEVEMITANGEVLRVNKENNTNLFWALRGGGGGNFGVVTSVKTIVHKTNTEKIFTGILSWDVTDNFDTFLNVLTFLNDFTLTIPNELSIYSIIMNGRVSKKDRLYLTFVYNGDFKTGSELIQPFISKLNGNVEMFKEQTFTQFITTVKDNTEINNKNGLLKSNLIDKGKLNEKVIKIIYNHMINRPNKLSCFHWSHIGGKVREFNDGSYFYRNAEFAFEINAIFNDISELDKNREWIESFASELSLFTNGSYVNFMDPYLKNWQQLYYGNNYERLVNIKRKYDSTNFFHFRQSIGN